MSVKEGPGRGKLPFGGGHFPGKRERVITVARSPFSGYGVVSLCPWVKTAAERERCGNVKDRVTVNKKKI